MINVSFTPDVTSVSFRRDYLNRKIHILSIIKHLFCGGTGSRLLAISKTLGEDLFDHTVIAINRPEWEVDERQRQYYVDAGIDVVDLGEDDSRVTRSSYLPHKAMAVVRVVRKVCRLIRESDVDIVDAHSEFACLIGFLAAKITGVKVVITLYHPPIRALWSFLGKFYAGMADAVITDSRARGQDIKQWKLGSRHNLFVIPNGIHPPSSIHTSLEMRKALGLPVDPKIKVIGTIGRFHRIKGQSFLLEAARAVLDEEPETAFLIVGYCFHKPDFFYKAELEKQASDLGIREHVRFISYPGPIGDIWQVIDIHVHPTLFDSLPIAITEGMSLCKPAVVTSVGGIPEMVEHDSTGLVVPPGNVEALSNSLLKLLRDPQAARRLGAAAQRRFQEQYTPHIRFRELEDVFVRLVNGQGRTKLANVNSFACPK